MFDARAANLLEAGKHITLPDHPGLRLEASKTGKKTWIYRYKSPVNGAMRQVKIGGWPAISYAKAAVEWENLRQRRDAGEDIAVEKKAQRAAEKEKAVAKAPAVLTVAALCDAYWAGHVQPHRKPKGATEIRRLFDKMLGEFGAVPAAEVTRTQAFDFIKGHAAKSPVLAGQLRTELGAAWEYALDSGRLADTCPNWWRQILRGKIRSKGKKIAGENIGVVKRVLSEPETGELIRWLPNFSKNVADVLTLYLWTACRGAEIVQMEGREIVKEATGWWWNIPKEKTKNARFEDATDLRVPLFGMALEVVLRRKERYGDGYLFPSRNNRCKFPYIEQKAIQAQVYFHQPYSETRPQDIRPRLTVTHWAPHDLRRTARTILASLGCPFEVSEAILGHMLPGVAGTYNRYSYDAERLEWLKKLSDHLEALVKRV